MADVPPYIFFRLLPGVIRCQEHVHRRYDKQGEKGPDGDPRGDDETQVVPAGGAGARCGNQGDDTQNHGRRGHEDRPEADGRRVFNGLAFTRTLALQIVCKFNDQDSVLADEADERNEAHLRVDVQARAADAEADENQRAADGQGNGHKNDDGIAEAFKLGRQRQKDDDHGEKEGEHQGRRFLNELPRLAGIVDRVTLGEETAGQILQVGQGFPLGHAGVRDAGERCRVLLLKMVQGLGDGLGFDMDDRGDRNRISACRPDIVVVQLIRIQAVPLLHLRDDLVGPPFEAEIVYMAAAEHGRQRASDVVHRQSQLRGQIPVDDQP